MQNKYASYKIIQKKQAYICHELGFHLVYRLDSKSVSAMQKMKHLAKLKQ